MAQEDLGKVQLSGLVLGVAGARKMVPFVSFQML